VLQRKDALIQKLRDGVGYQMARRGVQVLKGWAYWEDAHTLLVGDTLLQAQHIIIATGSCHIIPTFEGSSRVLTLSALLAQTDLPHHLTILGITPIGLGVATIYALLGCQVTLIDSQPNGLAGFDAELVELMLQQMPPVTIKHGVDVRSWEGDTLTLSNGETLTVERVVYAGARTPRLEGLGLEHIGLNVSAGKIAVDDRMRTAVPNLLCHWRCDRFVHVGTQCATHGEVVAHTILGQADRFRMEYIPRIIYSRPQLACVGMTEHEAHAQGVHAHRKTPLQHNGRFLTDYSPQARGLCKVVIHANTKQVLGVHLVGGNASEWINGAVAMLEDEFRVQDVRELVLIHPTITEAIRDVFFEV
jgi:dihydrolipoamide dehydrogenase